MLACGGCAVALLFDGADAAAADDAGVEAGVEVNASGSDSNVERRHTVTQYESSLEVRSKDCQTKVVIATESETENVSLAPSHQSGHYSSRS